jgi:hypothetical protein
MRRKRDRTAAMEATSDYGPRLVADQSRNRDAGLSQSADATIVVDDWPAILPVGDRELDMIETYLGQLIGDILKS